MLRTLGLAVACGLLLVAVGCVMVGAPVNGGVYTGVKGAGDVVDNTVQPTKSGMASATGIIGFAFGDASAKTAMAAGGITKVHHVETDFMQILGVYGKATTTVYGE
jgi:hypothetical protein